MSKCAKCGKEVDWEAVKDELGYILAQADALGVESLTEEEQMVYNGNICLDCFNN